MAMPRRPRHYLVGYPYHVVQRGTNRATTFFEDSDRRRYLSLWQRYARFHQLDVHAYCLMTNHVHFLVSPRKKDAISRVTQVVGSTYASYVNEKYERTGSLWEGRHRSSLVDSDQYLLTCYRYIELNPVRAGLVRVPGAYPWSSFRINASTATSWLAPHDAYLGLGKSAEDRIRAYLGMFDQSLADEDVDEISATINSGMPLARESFIVDLERRHDVDFGRNRRGRPKRARIKAG